MGPVRSRKNMARTRWSSSPRILISRIPIFAYVRHQAPHIVGRVLMGIYKELALKEKDIQDTIFSIDPIGNRICTDWDKVNKANETKRFDIVIVGAGMFGAYCAEKLFRRDTSNRLRILVLDAGPFFLPTQIQNLPISNMSN